MYNMLKNVQMAIGQIVLMVITDILNTSAQHNATQEDSILNATINTLQSLLYKLVIIIVVKRHN